MKANGEIKYGVNKCYGVTKDPNENDYLLVFMYARYGDLHNNLLKNFKFQKGKFIFIIKFIVFFLKKKNI